MEGRTVTRRVVGAVRDRAFGRGLHGHHHVSVQRAISLSLLGTGIVRTLFWLAVMVAQLVGVGVVRHISHDVTAVFFISLYANFATDLDQVTASFAALFSADSHHDAEHVRARFDAGRPSLTASMEIAAAVRRLATIPRGTDAQQLADRICNQLTGAPE